MRAYFFFILLFFSIAGVSQNLDSLKSQLRVVADSQRFDVILSYMRSTLTSDPQASYNISNFAIDYALNSGDSMLVAKAYYAKGFILRRLSKNNEAIEVFIQAYGIAKRNRFLSDLSRILNSLAIAYTYAANYDKALEMHFECLVLNEQLERIEDVGISLNNIGLVYFKLGNTKEALRHYERSLAVKQGIKSSFDIERLYVNMALCYNQIRAYKESETYIKKAFSFCKQLCDEEILMEGDLVLAISYLERGKIEDAVFRTESSLKHSANLANRRYEMEGLITLARILLVKNQASDALERLSQAEVIAEGSGYSESLMEIYKRKADAFLGMSDYKSASIFNKKYSDLRDSIVNDELINNLATIQAKYAERENLSTIADNERVIRAQRQLNFAIAFIIILSFFLIYLIMRNSRAIRRLNAKLALEVEKKTKELVRTNHYLKQVNDELDNLVYKTSHDIRGPLATLKGICNIALMDVKDPEAITFLKKLDNTSTLLNQVLDKFSRVNEIYNTYVIPKPVDIGKLVDDILQTQKKTERLKSIEVQTEIATIEGFESEPRLLHYVLNSLIDNAFRYYNESNRIASYVKVKVERVKDEVAIHIIDNGVGIPINIDSDSLFHMFTRGSERSLTGGMGLFIATIATRKLQGEIEFQRSEDFLVTEFVLTLPIKMDPTRIEKPRERGPAAPSQVML